MNPWTLLLIVINEIVTVVTASIEIPLALEFLPVRSIPKVDYSGRNKNYTMDSHSGLHAKVTERKIDASETRPAGNEQATALHESNSWGTANVFHCRWNEATDVGETRHPRKQRRPQTCKQPALFITNWSIYMHSGRSRRQVTCSTRKSSP